MTNTTSRRQALGVLVAQAVAFTVFVAAWEWVTRTGMVNPLFIGEPSKIFVFFFKGLFVNHVMLKEAGWTLAETAVAFFLGSAGGILFGLLFAVFPLCERFFDPLMSGLNSLPRIALAPVFVLWFGLGPASKVALGVSLSFFIVLYNTMAGVRGVNTDWVVLSRMLGASRASIFFKVTLMSAVPTIFSGLKLGLIVSLLGVIAGGIIAGQHGLGQLLSYLAGTFETDGVFAVLLLLAIIGAALTSLMNALERHLLRWR